MADLRLVRQIAANLISNAVKYSPESRDVAVTFKRSGDHLELSIQDHGIGIPEADQQTIFDSFKRASNTGAIAGTGLGMAIVKEAAEIHGGSVHLESQVGVGTTARVRLPA